MSQRIDFSPIHAAKLGPSDLRRLCHVSRVSCSMWLNGHVQPHYLLTERVQKVVDGVQAALDAGLLPVPVTVMNRERGFYIQQAVEKAVAAAATN